MGYLSGKVASNDTLHISAGDSPGYVQWSGIVQHKNDRSICKEEKCGLHGTEPYVQVVPLYSTMGPSVLAKTLYDTTGLSDSTG